MPAGGGGSDLGREYAIAQRLGVTAADAYAAGLAGALCDPATRDRLAAIGAACYGRRDGYEIRSAAVAADVPCATTVPGAAAAVMGVEALIRGDLTVRPLQQLHPPR